MSSEDENLDLSSVFTEPSRPPTPEATIATYTRDAENITIDSPWEEIKIRLVGSHPLWGHYLWNAAIALASFLDHNRELYENRYVLELGAGGGLPSLVTAKNHARKAVITDYPDVELTKNITLNVSQNFEESARANLKVQGYIWGQSVTPLLSTISTSQPSMFDLILLSDLIFNHSQHDALLKTCEEAISSADRLASRPPPCVLVFYSHHRPHLAHRDMEFFTKARERGWQCDEVLTRTFPLMFPEDSGDESIRSTVHGWKLTREQR